mgnify:CR=1 FL=1
MRVCARVWLVGTEWCFDVVVVGKKENAMQKSQHRCMRRYGKHNLVKNVVNDLFLCENHTMEFKNCTAAQRNIIEYASNIVVVSRAQSRIVIRHVNAYPAIVDRGTLVSHLRNSGAGVPVSNLCGTYKFVKDDVDALLYGGTLMYAEGEYGPVLLMRPVRADSWAHGDGMSASGEMLALYNYGAEATMEHMGIMRRESTST